MGQDDKITALEAAITKIEKDFGKGAIMKLGDSGNHMNVETVPTGSLSLDVALGLGGVPKGAVGCCGRRAPGMRRQPGS